MQSPIRYLSVPTAILLALPACLPPPNDDNPVSDTTSTNDGSSTGAAPTTTAPMPTSTGSSTTDVSQDTSTSTTENPQGTSTSTSEGSEESTTGEQPPPCDAGAWNPYVFDDAQHAAYQLHAAVLADNGDAVVVGRACYEPTCAGLFDLFVLRLDLEGNERWLRFISSNHVNFDNYAIGQAVAVDDSGDVYVAGTFSGEIKTDTPEMMRNSLGSGAADYLVASLDGVTGDWEWVTTSSSTDKTIPGNESAWSLAIGANTVAITGSCDNDSFPNTDSGALLAIFDPTNGVQILAAAEECAELPNNGEKIADTRGNQIVARAGGGYIVVGDFNTSLSLPGTPPLAASLDNWTGFMVQYGEDGQQDPNFPPTIIGDLSDGHNHATTIVSHGTEFFVGGDCTGASFAGNTCGDLPSPYVARLDSSGEYTGLLWLDKTVEGSVLSLDVVPGNDFQILAAGTRILVNTPPTMGTGFGAMLHPNSPDNNTSWWMTGDLSSVNRVMVDSMNRIVWAGNIRGANEAPFVKFPPVDAFTFYLATECLPDPAMP